MIIPFFSQCAFNVSDAALWPHCCDADADVDTSFCAHYYLFAHHHRTIKTNFSALSWVQFDADRVVRLDADELDKL